MPLAKSVAQESARDIQNKTLKKRVCVRTTKNASVALLTKYALPNSSVIQDNILQDLLLPYRLYKKNLAKIIRKYRLAIKLENKYKILYAELRNRWHVDDPLNDVLAITDIDDGYFRYLNDHPRTECIPFYKSLTFLYNKQIRTKQDIGCRRDDVLNIEINHRRELLKYQCSVQIYMEQVKQFDVFISEDYQKSITCLRKSEMLYTNLIDAKNLELFNLASTQFSIQSKLIGINYLYYQQQKYGRFLYYISPHYWRAKHRDFGCSVEIEAKGFDLGISNEEDTFNAIFENMKCASLVKPALYFSQPKQLMKMFESTEKQQLHHFTHVAQLKPHTITLQKVIQGFKEVIKNDALLVANEIQDYENLLHFEEEKASQLEAKFMKILNGSFYDSVAAIDVLKLQMNLEWCFEKIFKVKSNLSLGPTAKALENMYMKYTYDLEMFDNVETKAALKQSVAEEEDMMKKAHMAARELRQFARLERSLMRTHGKDDVVIAPVPVVKRPAICKPKVQQIKPVVRHSSQRQPTDAEIEYLHLFTDWTEKENPAKYLQSL